MQLLIRIDLVKWKMNLINFQKYQVMDYVRE